MWEHQRGKHVLSCLQDVMFEALSDKVSEVHKSCVGNRMTNLNTLEKLASIESHMVLLLLSLESIPKEMLEILRKTKDSERRTRCSVLDTT